MNRTDCIREQREVVRDALAGDLAVKARGEAYLPKLVDQSAADYKRYQDRGKYYAIPERTLTTMVGTALSKPPTIELPARLAPMQRVCGISGVPMANIIEEALSEALSVGTIGLLLWHPGGQDHPRIATYTAETIIGDPVVEWADGVQKLTSVTLKDGSKQVEDGVRDISLTLYLNPEDEGRCWIKRTLDSDVVITDMRYDVGPWPLKEIPFILASFDGVSPRISDKVPMYALSRLAIQTWATSAEKNNTIYRAGFPQYWIAGAVSDDAVPRVTGPGQIWVFPEGTVVGREQADAGAAALHEQEIQAAVLQMLQMGAGFMGAGNSTGTASSTNHEVASMKLRGQTALLHQTVSNLEEAFKRILGIAIQWQYGTTSGKLTANGVAAMDELAFVMNREYVEAGLAPAMFKVLHEMTGMQYLSPQTLYEILSKNGFTSPRDFETDQSLIEHDPMAMLRGGGLPPEMDA